jgi:hypothetical protein
VCCWVFLIGLSSYKGAGPKFIRFGSGESAGKFILLETFYAPGRNADFLPLMLSASKNPSHWRAALLPRVSLCCPALRKADHQSSYRFLHASGASKSVCVMEWEAVFSKYDTSLLQRGKA